MEAPKDDRPMEESSESLEERVAFVIWLCDSGGPASAYRLHKERNDAVHRRFLGLSRAAIDAVRLEDATDKFLAEERERIKRRFEADSQVARWVKERLNMILDEK